MVTTSIKWRFWDTREQRMHMTSSKEIAESRSKRYIAMKRLLPSSAGLVEVYACDVLQIPRYGTETFVALWNGIVEGEHGQLIELASLRDYAVIGTIFDHEI